jgi:uncharacterized protein YcbK (DUF882 family)
VVHEGELRDAPLFRPSGELKVYAVNFREQIKVDIYNSDGSFNQAALRELDRVFRCKRTGDAKQVDPRLYELLGMIYDHFGGRRLELVSGYRNQRRTTSFHYHATAADIRVDGVAPSAVHAFVATLDSGGMGIGMYPRAGFVHVDVRPPPSYRWVDNSRAGSRDPGKLPPRRARVKRTAARRR